MYPVLLEAINVAAVVAHQTNMNPSQAAQVSLFLYHDDSCRQEEGGAKKQINYLIIKFHTGIIRVQSETYQAACSMSCTAIESTINTLRQIQPEMSKSPLIAPPCGRTKLPSV